MRNEIAADVYHPATFSAAILTLIRQMGVLPDRGVVIDPFAGVGGVHCLATDTLTTIGVEIEPEWAGQHPRTLLGNALALPFGTASFDAAVTSPCYGNRMADHHRARDGSRRRSYTHDLQRTTGDPDRQLHTVNAGRMYAWRPDYWEFHTVAWRELARVLKAGAPFLLNASDFIRAGKVIGVVEGHRNVATSAGFRFRGQCRTPTPRMRYGENRDLRVDREVVMVFEREGR